jgi:hypothetical protein
VVMGADAAVGEGLETGLEGSRLAASRTLSAESHLISSSSLVAQTTNVRLAVMILKQWSYFFHDDSPPGVLGCGE